MGELASKRLGDLLPTIDAYRPVALATAAILGLTFVLPGAENVGNAIPPYAASDASSVSDQAASGPANQPADTGASSSQSQASAAPSVDSSSGSSSFTSPPSAPGTSSSDTTSSGTSSGDSTSQASPSDSDATAPSTGSGFTTDFDSGSDEESEPLRIVEFGWASSTGGTPLSDAGVPEDTLPVGTRIGQDDKVSFVRLSGDEMQLVLTENEEGRRGSEFEVSPVQVCKVTDSGWEAGGEQSMSDAPEWDADNCVSLEPGTDGTWSANLFLFGDPTDEGGFALVPSPDAPLDFQVTFETQTA